MNASSGGFEKLRQPLSAVNGATGSTAAGRVVAVILAVTWGTVGFGVIDLETAIPPEDPVVAGSSRAATGSISPRS
jgi:hypothetical protein